MEDTSSRLFDLRPLGGKFRELRLTLPVLFDGLHSPRRLRREPYESKRRKKFDLGEFVEEVGGSVRTFFKDYSGGRIVSSSDHPNKEQLIAVQDFFRYSELEGKKFFEELDRDGDGRVTLEDLEIAMRKRRLPRSYAQQFLHQTRTHFFSNSIQWKQFRSLMEKKESAILKAYTNLSLTKNGTLEKDQILATLQSVGLPINEHFKNDEESVSYGRFRNFMLLLPSQRLPDSPRNGVRSYRTKDSAELVMKIALAGGMVSAVSNFLLHSFDSAKVIGSPSFSALK